MMGVKRKRDVPTELEVAEHDSVQVKSVIETFAGTWTADHWKHAVVHQDVIKECLESMIGVLGLKNMTPIQVGTALIEAFPHTQALEDYDQNDTLA